MEKVISQFAVGSRRSRLILLTAPAVVWWPMRKFPRHPEAKKFFPISGPPTGQSDRQSFPESISTSGACFGAHCADTTGDLSAPHALSLFPKSPSSEWSRWFSPETMAKRTSFSPAGPIAWTLPRKPKPSSLFLSNQEGPSSLSLRPGRAPVPLSEAWGVCQKRPGTPPPAGGWPGRPR